MRTETGTMSWQLGQPVSDLRRKDLGSSRKWKEAPLAGVWSERRRAEQEEGAVGRSRLTKAVVPKPQHASQRRARENPGRWAPLLSF